MIIMLLALPVNGPMGDLNGMKNWYKKQPACLLNDPALFYGYDKKIHGPVSGS